MQPWRSCATVCKKNWPMCSGSFPISRHWNMSFVSLSESCNKEMRKRSAHCPILQETNKFKPQSVECKSKGSSGTKARIILK